MPTKIQSKKTKAVSMKQLTVKVFDMMGKSTGTLSLPRDVFGQTPNKNLLAQAVRVYSANAIKNTANTKTRGEVRGGGVKPWKQKGTGRARAGSRRSPLWVGGGITFGPRYKDVRLSLPQKMRQKALIHALSDKAISGNIKVISGIEKVNMKTKPVANLLKSLEVGKNALIVVSQKGQNLKLATRNIPNLFVDITQNLNAFQILSMNHILLSKEAIAGIGKVEKTK